MAKRTMWKVAAAVLAVVVAGIVYCIFFAEEKDDTVQYRTGEESAKESADGSLVDGIPSDDKNGSGTVSNGFVTETNDNDNASVSADNIGGSTVQNSGSLVYVHVCGAVKNPAVYSLPEGSRVCDAITKAGGLTENAADDYVNQARFLNDGERVYIPEKDELSSLNASQYAAGQSVASIGGSQVKLPVNINTAGISELTTLPGIGESRAESIIAYREKHGAFSKIEDIMKISGIKGAAYEKIKDRICTGNE